MRIGGVSDFTNSTFLIFMIIGGAMVIPAGQSLFARLFGQADDMHAGGGFLHNAFYGGRIASALTFGMAMKTIRGLFGVGRRVVGHRRSKNDKPDKTDKYSEIKDDTSTTTEGDSV